jgi:hypothetical protein
MAMELSYLKNDVVRDEMGKIICHHNQECRCTHLECHKCGWNPKVAEKRTKKIRKELGCDEEEV